MNHGTVMLIKLIKEHKPVNKHSDEARKNNPYVTAETKDFIKKRRNDTYIFKVRIFFNKYEEAMSIVTAKTR